MLKVLLTLIAALGLSIAAAYYSIIGLMAIFSGAAFAIAVMAGFMEFGKIVSAVWLHNNWKTKHGLLKWYLMFSVFVLMLITSMGIYGFLSKSYLETQGDTVQIEEQIVYLERQKDLIEKDLERNGDILFQLDAAIEEYISRGFVTRGLNAREEQSEERALIRESNSELMSDLSEIESKTLELTLGVRNLENELGPIKYISELIYGEKAEENIDNSVRIVILLLIFVFDPLAILLLIATQVSYDEWKRKRNKVSYVEGEEAVDLRKVNIEDDMEVRIAKKAERMK